MRTSITLTVNFKGSRPAFTAMVLKTLGEVAAGLGVNSAVEVTVDKTVMED